MTTNSAKWGALPPHWDTTLSLLPPPLTVSYHSTLLPTNPPTLHPPLLHASPSAHSFQAHFPNPAPTSSAPPIIPLMLSILGSSWPGSIPNPPTASTHASPSNPITKRTLTLISPHIVTRFLLMGLRNCAHPMGKTRW